MASFTDFKITLNSDGKQFEHFVKWFLKNDPEWSTQVAQIWLWDEYPDRWGRDCGVDLVFKHKNGETWAIQAKCYSNQYSVTKHDIDKFLSESNRSGIDKRLLIATTDRISANAKQVCDAQEKQVVRFMLWDFEQAAVEYPENLSDLNSAKRRDPPKPRDYQQQAIKNVVAGFKDAGRGQLIMACGTGKTFTSLWIKECLFAQKTLVLLPSLSLLSQTLREWTFASKNLLDILCVCSDQTVGKRGADEAISSISDVAFPVTSDVRDIKNFLLKEGDQVVFCTYQSSSLISETQKYKNIPAFDLTIADEAHRCAGKTDGLFSTVLDQKLIRSEKRLFMTATPRTFSSSVKKSAEERGVEVVGMGDETVFGKVFHSLSFGEAISRTPPLLTDYRVVIIGVDDETISEWIQERKFVQTESGLETDAESLAAQVGLLKGIKDYSIRRAISFHSRVSRARRFSESIMVTAKYLAQGEFKSNSIWSDYVSGEMPTDKRRAKIGQLQHLSHTEHGLLANARCLSEGVDVPSLDGVAFVDPRKSQVDIIQAVGRAIRLSPDKIAGTIVLPVFVKGSNEAEASVELSRFKPIWDVLNALKAHDDVLAAELDQIRVSLGRRVGCSVSRQAISKLIIDLPKSIDDSFGRSLSTVLVEKTTESWLFWYGLLQTYLDEAGHCYVPQNYVTCDSYRLGNWTNTQRVKRHDMPSNRRELLEALPGWAWDVKEAKWEEAYSELKQFEFENGHCRVPSNYVTNNSHRLGRWVVSQRRLRWKLSPERIKRFETLNGWVWNSREANWERGLNALRSYTAKFGNSFVPEKHVTTNGFKLGAWVSERRSTRKRIPSRYRRKLETIPSWEWSVKKARWEEAFQALQRYVEIHGSCSIPDKYQTSDGRKLGRWVVNQRIRKDRMPSPQKVKLASLPGWVWDARDARWEMAFTALKYYSDCNGNCLVPSTFVSENGLKLGQWVVVQRSHKSKLSKERRERLSSLPGWVWNTVEARWESAYQAASLYSVQFGDCRIKVTYKTEDGLRLGKWVSVQRQQYKLNQLSKERQKRLERLCGWTWSVSPLKHIARNGD